MNSSDTPDLLKSPKLSFINKEPTIIIKAPKKLRFTPRITRPAFIARKINPEEIYSSTVRQSIMVELSKIKEEGADEVDLLYPPDTESELDLTMRETKNLFRNEGIISAKYKEPNKGPIYKNDKIVKHSILGSVEAFERQQKNQQKKTRSRGGSIQSSDHDSKTEASASKLMKTTNLPSLNEVSFTSMGRLGTSMVTIPRKVSMRERIKESRREIKVEKEDLMTKITEMKKTQENFYTDRTHLYYDKPFEEKLILTKEERRLKKFDETTEDWQKRIHLLSAKANKRPEQALMRTVENFREKVELANILETTKTVQERVGDNFWRINLRTQGADSERGDYSLATQYPSGEFRPPSLNKANKSVEVIKKSGKILRELDSSQFPVKPKYLDRTHDEYLQGKFIKFRNLIKKVNPIDLEQVRGLVVKTCKFLIY